MTLTFIIRAGQRPERAYVKFIIVAVRHAATAVFAAMYVQTYTPAQLSKIVRIKLDVGIAVISTSHVIVNTLMIYRHVV